MNNRLHVKLLTEQTQRQLNSGDLKYSRLKTSTISAAAKVHENHSVKIPTVSLFAKL